MRTEDLWMRASADVGELGVKVELPAVSVDAELALARLDEAGAKVASLDGPVVEALGYELSGDESLLDLDALALAARSAWKFGGQDALDAASALMRTTGQEGAGALAWANALLQADEIPYEPYRFQGSSREERFGRGVLADAVEAAPARWPLGVAASAQRGDELAGAVLASLDCERYGRRLREEVAAGELGYLACPSELGEASVKAARVEMDAAPALEPGEAEEAAARLEEELGWKFDPGAGAPGDLAVLDALSRASTPEERDAARTWAGSIGAEGRDEAAALAAALEEPGMVGYVAYSEAAKASFSSVEGRLGFDESREAPLTADWPDYVDAGALGREVARSQGWELLERGACGKAGAERVPLDFYGREDVVAFVREETPAALPVWRGLAASVPAAELDDTEIATPLRFAPPRTPEEEIARVRLPGKRRPAPRPTRSVESPRSPAEERARLKEAPKAPGRAGPKAPPSRAR